MSNKTTTTTTSRVDVWEHLTAEEEQVVRMRYGIALKPEEELELRGQRHPETRAQLARMEQEALDALNAPRHSGPPTNQRVKSHILSRLREE